MRNRIVGDIRRVNYAASEVVARGEDFKGRLNALCGPRAAEIHSHSYGG